MEDRELLRQVLRKLDELETGVTRLVGAIEAEDQYRERVEKLLEKERDDRHEQLETALGDLKLRVENAGASMREMPERLLQHVKKTIYELRSAEWEARQAGAMGAAEHTPLQLPPYREQTGKIATARSESDEIALTPAQQRGIVSIAATAWRWGRWVLLPMIGGAAKWIHELVSKSIGH